jgi:hypothetical protein
MVIRLEGRPLTRDEERRIVAQITERQPGIPLLGTARGGTIEAERKRKPPRSVPSGRLDERHQQRGV